MVSLQMKTFVALMFLCLPIVAEAKAQDKNFEPSVLQAETDVQKLPIIQPTRTDSPRETLDSFLRLRDELEALLLDYQTDRSRANAFRWNRVLAPQFRSLIDLSSHPTATREDAALETISFLLDIFGRIDLPALEQVPDEARFDSDGPAVWRVPGSPIRIVRIEKGPRSSEFLFSADTINVAPRFYRQIAHLPLRSRLEFESWRSELLQLTGPIIPAGLVNAIPQFMRKALFDTPVWKILTVVLVAALAALLLRGWHRFLVSREASGRISASLVHLMSPLGIIWVVKLLDFFFSYELSLVGTFSNFMTTATTVVTYLAYLWIFWLSVKVFFEALILSPNIPDESLDANLLRLIARIIGFVGGVLIIAICLQRLGIPFLSVLTGLGIGGVAVALAIRPTLENLIGGMVLFIDKPVRVGDFCSFGDKTGNVESIGVRSTQIRALDRTTISIPNAQFADMQVVNWARCDRMMIQTTIGLRYETLSDQLRHVLVKMREMFYAHPKIDRDTIRVRFAGYGGSSLDIDVRVYALTRDWNEFYGIREDVYLRINDIVRASGTDFAFPSRTLYMGRDGGLDTEAQKAAIEEVQTWRRSGRLPFPRFTPERLDELEGTIDYPPKGSPETYQPESNIAEASEPLSAEPVLDDSSEPESDRPKQKP